MKTPHTDIRMRGRIPRKLIAALREHYGSKVILGTEDEEEMVDVFRTEWYRAAAARRTPGGNLRIYRRNRGLSQNELGALLGGVPRQHVSNMESGIRPISKKVALKLARIFDTSVDRFIG